MESLAEMSGSCKSFHFFLIPCAATILRSQVAAFRMNYTFRSQFRRFAPWRWLCSAIGFKAAFAIGWIAAGDRAPSGYPVHLGSALLLLNDKAPLLPAVPA